MDEMKNYVPLWHKFALTITEGAKYFGIGEKKIRQIVNDDPSADYLLWVGAKALIKRNMFENYLEGAGAI